MSCESREKWIDDYLDGSLGAPRREELERHLGTCDTCRGEVAARQAILDRAGGLPRSIEPGRDLWPGIRAAAREGRAASAPTAWRRGWVPWGALAASLAAASLLALSLRSMRQDAAPRATAAATPTAGVETVRTAEREYREAAGELLAAIEHRSDRLTPETLEVIRRNLAIVDEAIGEIRATMDEAPPPPGADLALNSMYHRKLDLLWRVSRLSS